MEEALPGLQSDIEDIFRRYREERQTYRGRSSPPDSSHEDVNQVEEDLRFATEDDEGGTDSFFAWFFRGQGPSGILSGAAFQKNRLASISSAYATLFEEDHVAWLLKRPENALDELA